MLVDIEIVKSILLKNISKKYNIEYDDLIEELNLVSNIKTIKSKYYCDHFFFSRDNEISFYWAGFIAADGCVFKKTYNNCTLSINLAEKDLLHLKKFKENIGFTGKIYKSVSYHSKENTNWNDSHKNSISISSVNIFQDLERFNIVPNKTKIYTTPEWLVEHNLFRHFLRGYIDGDGSFWHDKSRDRVCFELRGTYEFLSGIKSKIEECFSKRTQSKVTTPDSTSKIRYFGRSNVKDLVNYLYKDSNICMERKYNIAKQAL